MGSATRPWWEPSVIYQVYPRSFADSNGDGIGDLHGITQRLDYLARLGIDAIWLSPIFRSPMADFGYDVADYTDVDPMFGSLADLDALVAAAHGRGIKVLLDFVPNHTSNLHPWFLQSRSSRSDPRRGWYIWRDASPGGGPPNAWQSVFGGSAWEWDEATGQYYFHSFLAEQPDLDWENPAVRDAMHDVLRFWFRRGIDGFRIDVIQLLAKRRELLPMRPGQRQVWSDLRHVQDHVAGIRRVADEFSGRVLIGEIWLPLKGLVAFYGTNLTGLQLPFNFALITVPWSAAPIASAIARYEALLPAGAWPNWVLGNHDRSRIASRVGYAQARVAAMLLLTLRGTPTLYYGDELGMRDADIPPAAMRDPEGLRGGKSRDPERTPMRWDGSENGGFTTGQPWLPMGDDVATINVVAERLDAGSMLELHRRLLALRRAEPALSVGDWAHITAEGDLLAYERRAANGARFVVALNLGHRELTADVGRGQIVLSTALDRDGETVHAPLHLRPNEGVVVKAAEKGRSSL
jgi:alpha-glucosidase